MSTMLKPLMQKLTARREHGIIHTSCIIGGGDLSMWFFKKKKDEAPKQAVPQVQTEERTFIPFVTTEELNRRLATEAEGLQVVDVRELYEWQSGHIKEATHIPLGALPMQVHTLDKDKVIFLICQSGGRSAHATKLLRDRGFEKAYNVVGGMGEWDMRNFPMIQDEQS